MITQLIQILINGIFTGAGVAIGTYYATRLVIKKIETLEQKINEKINPS